MYLLENDFFKSKDVVLLLHNLKYIRCQKIQSCLTENSIIFIWWTLKKPVRQ
jgi:hypothetical protein